MNEKIDAYDAYTRRKQMRVNEYDAETRRKAHHENVRHNLATENATRISQIETRRHNIATEGYYNNQLAETIRHNQELESVQRSQVEVSWYNAKVNKMNAQSSAKQAEASLHQARTARMNAQTKRKEADIAQKKYELEADMQSAKKANMWVNTITTGISTFVEANESAHENMRDTSIALKNISEAWSTLLFPFK